MTRRLPKENDCKWPSLCTVVLGFFLITFSLEAQTRGDTSIEQVKREFIVEFKPGILTLPQGRTKGRLNEFEISSQELHQILVNARVSEISRLIPNFVTENRFKMTRTGETVELTDWSNVYLLRLAVPMMRDSLLNTMSRRPEVIYAEPNILGKLFTDPNDPHFSKQWAMKNEGTGAQGGGTNDADIDAEEAWEITTGSSAINIAIVDGGMQTDHQDFTGRVIGDIGDNDYSILYPQKMWERIPNWKTLGSTSK